MSKNRVKPKKTFFLSTFSEYDMSSLVETVADALGEPENFDVFIARLDQAAQDWDVTYRLIRHFKALEEVYLKEALEEGENEDLSPKLIKDLI